MSWGEFYATLGVDADVLTVKKFAQALGDIPLIAAGAISALAGLEFGFMNMTGNALNAAVGFNMFTAETGLNSQELQRWQYVAKSVGGTAESVTSSIAGIQAKLAGAQMGDAGAAQGFARAKIQWMGRDPMQILKEVQESFPRIIGEWGYGRAQALLGQMGISPEMMATFKLSPSQFNSRFNRSPEMDQGQIDSLLQLKLQLTELSRVLGVEFNRVLTPLIPAMEKLVVVFAHLLETIGPFVVQFATGTIKNMDAVASGSFYKKFKENLANEWSLPFQLPQLPNLAFGGVGARSSPSLSLIQHNYGTGDPVAFADYVNKGIGRSVMRATQTIFNGGY